MKEKRNIRTTGKNFNNIPKRELVEMITDLGDNDSCIVILSKGVIDKDFARTRNQRVQSMIIKVNPDVAAHCIYNQAMGFNEADECLRFCQMLRDIANSAEESIRLETKKSTIQN